MSSNILFVFSSISLSEFLVSFLGVSNILLNLLFRTFFSASSVFGCSGLGVVGSLDFTCVVLFFVVLYVFLSHLLIFSSNWCC